MATKYTQNLKLILEDSLTSVARTNLQRIDSLGNSFLITSSRSLDIRALSSINLRPNANEVGGNGSGGVVNVGSSSQEIASFNVWATLASFTGNVSVADTLYLRSNLYTLGLKADNLTSDLLYVLPSTDGNAGQVLTTNGSGELSWSSALGGSNPAFTTTWTTGDGTTKSIVHNLDTTNISVVIKEIATSEIVGINSITINSTNTVTLTSTEAPGAGNWSVYIFAN